MAVYSYHYGASVERGITIQAQSKELSSLPVQSALKALAAMHALDGADQSGEMLSYLLSDGGYTIFGTSYTESPKSSGYSRSAPCGLIYVAPDDEVENRAANLGKIVNFANFQKPQSASPTPLRDFPVNESGYSFHNTASVLAPLVEGLIRVAFSQQDDVLLVALPRGKNSGYAAVRYAIAEALGCMPIELRTRIKFFTGLPVGENENDPLIGFDNAYKFGANVIFCSAEHFARLKSYRTCITLDLERQPQPVGAFAEFIAHVPDVSAKLSLINGCIGGWLTYDALNNAAVSVQRGEIVTTEDMQKELAKMRGEYNELSRRLKAANAEVDELRQQYSAANKRNEELQMQIRRGPAKSGMQTSQQVPAAQRPQSRSAGSRTEGGHSQQRMPARQQNAEYQPLFNTKPQPNNYNDRYENKDMPPSYDNLPPVEQKETEQEESRTLYWIANIFAALLLVVISIVGTVLFMEKSDNPKPKQPETSITEETAVPEATGLAEPAAVTPVPAGSEESAPLEPGFDPTMVEDDGEANGALRNREGYLLCHTV